MLQPRLYTSARSRLSYKSSTSVKRQYCDKGEEYWFKFATSTCGVIREKRHELCRHASVVFSLALAYNLYFYRSCNRSSRF